MDASCRFACARKRALVLLARPSARFDEPRARAACPLLLAFSLALLACETPEPGANPPPQNGTFDAASSIPPAPFDAGLPPQIGLDATLGAGSDANGAAPAASPLPCEVSAILSQHCGSCHGQTTNFGAPMSLVTWNDLHKPSARRPDRLQHQLVLERVKNDASPMPPAPNPRLSADKIATLERWVAQGAPAGTQACTPSAGNPDAGSDAGPSPSSEVPKPADCQATYELRAHGGTGAEDTTPFPISSNPTLEGNQYHCFYFKPPYNAGYGLLWFESLLDNTPKLHHWILYASDQKVQPDGTSAPCNANQPGSYFVVGWAPGATNTVVSNDVMLQLPSGPNAQLILELHYYNNTGKSEPDRTGVRFCTGAPNTRPHTAAVHTLGTEGICIEPNTRGHEVAGSCLPRSDMGDIHITGVWPHMHKRARRMQVVVKRSGGMADVIHDAPFDFNAQIFHPKQNVVVRAGDSVETHCFYDNDSSEAIKYGERTQDEMCYAFITAWPAGSLLPTGGGGGGASLGLPANRCADALSILGSCNGILDAPVTVEHPP
jgi:mono/diheme cytochrome c family protein